jgi:hypothetical protein
MYDERIMKGEWKGIMISIANEIEEITISGKY